MIFESTLEKLARIMASKWGVDVVFEGKSAYTDGKKIVLPALKNVDKELERDLNGLLDHEVGHIKFTDFKEVNKLKNKFTELLSNAMEDPRIEAKMIEEFPGTQLNLDPLNEKVKNNLINNFSKLPLPIQVIAGIRLISEGRTFETNPKLEGLLDKVKHLIPMYQNADSTKEVIDLSTKIAKIVKQKLEEEEQETKGKSKKEKAADKENAEYMSKDVEQDEKDKSKGDGSSIEGDGNGEPKPGGDYSYTKFLSPEETVNDSIRGKFKKIEDNSVGEYVPLTTKFDIVTSHVKDGNFSAYVLSREKVKPLIIPIRTRIERIMKVKEEAKWVPERESGKINSSSLSKLVSNKGHRNVFKEFRKQVTNNVAVQILVDMSGSMSYKLETTKQALIALAESLQGLGIPFEVTGYHTTYNPKLNEYVKEYQKNNSLDGFIRTDTCNHYHVFKEFFTNDLKGISELNASGGNCDNEAVRWAVKRLSEQRQKRKIMLVLCDGEVCLEGIRENVVREDYKQTIKDIGKHGIECIGVGIETQHVKDYFPDHVFIEVINDLPTKTMEKLEKLLSK